MAISPAQIHAARQLANLTQADIARATGLSIPTIKRAELDRDASVSAVAAIVAALDASGVEFIAENGGGPGVPAQAAEQAGVDRRRRPERQQRQVASRKAIAREASVRTGTGNLRFEVDVLISGIGSQGIVRSLSACEAGAGHRRLDSGRAPSRRHAAGARPGARRQDPRPRSAAFR